MSIGKLDDACEYAGAAEATGTLISIPIYPSLTDQEVERLLRVSEEALC